MSGHIPPYTGTPALLRIPLDQVEAGPNARGDVGDVAELAASMRALGQQVPVIVEQLDNGRYRLLDGHRRRAAAARAGLGHLDAVVRAAPRSAADRLVRQIAIQGHARAFDPMAEARTLHALMFDHKLSREQIAHLVGRSPGWVRDRISLVHLAPDEKLAVERGRMSVAEALLRLKNRREIREGRPPTQGTTRSTPPTPPPAVRLCDSCPQRTEVTHVGA